MSRYGKLTVKGSLAFEEKLSSVLEDISKDINLLIDESLYEAIILIGGYGRGEGGVIKINDNEFPHNNFDFVVISKEIKKDDILFLEKQCKEIFDRNTKKLDIFVEFSIISSSKLNSLDPLVITYDMKYGHKLIAGNSDRLKTNPNFELYTIPSWDIRNLIVNRGTLLIINDLILSKELKNIKDDKTVIKHWIKAIIGYGDALLYYLGLYHFSYVEKQKRMREITCIDERFKALYDRAMNFRFEPNYKKYEKFNLKTYQKFVKKELEKVHFKCEQLALDNVQIDSVSYINKAVDESLSTNSSLKASLKKIYYFTKKVPFIKKLSFLQNIKYKMLGMKGMMPILFPYIAYGIRSEVFDSILKDFFQVNKNEENSMKNQYLVYWKKYVNSNFIREDFGL